MKKKRKNMKEISQPKKEVKHNIKDDILRQKKA